MPFLARFKPLTAPILKRLRSPALPEVEVLQEEEIQSVRPPSLLPGMLERTTATPPPAKLSHHVANATATQLTHKPVLRWRYQNVLVFPSGFSTWSAHDSYGTTRRIEELTKSITNISKLRYCSNSLAGRYFGHWLSDAVPSALIDPDEGLAWLHFDPTWGHAKQYLDLFELPTRQIPLVHAKEMIVYQDFGQGSHKQNRYALLRSKLRTTFGNPSATDLVYLRRGTTGSRRVIANEVELIDKLSALNWKILDVDNADVSELQSAICRAQVVTSIEGSHLNHAQFGLAAGGSLIILVPGDRFTTLHVGRASVKQIATGMVVLEGDQINGYHVDLGEVLRTVEMTVSRC